MLDQLTGSAVLIPNSVFDLITATDAASLCGVTPDAVRQWASRGQLNPSGMDSRGRKLYRLIDVAKAERATRKRAGRQ